MKWLCAITSIVTTWFMLLPPHNLDAALATAITLGILGVAFSD